MYINELIIEDDYLPSSQFWHDVMNDAECMRSIAFAMMHADKVYRKTACGDLFLMTRSERADMQNEYLESAVLLEAQRD